MATNNYSFPFTRVMSIIMISIIICAVLGGCAYLLYQRYTNYQTSELGNITSDQPAPGFLQKLMHITATKEIIHDPVVTITPPTKARLLYVELQSHDNFKRALENPQARENVDRLLNHPEIEKKLNGWFASLIRRAIYERVNEPNFPELIANPKYVDDLFEKYGIA